MLQILSSAAVFAFGAEPLNSCHAAISANCTGLGDARACMDCVRLEEPTFLAANCTAKLVRSVCGGDTHPNVFGCSDVTADGCGGCYDHAVLFEKVCVWCLEDSECHDVGSLEDPCSSANCISAAVGTTCTDQNRSDCPSLSTSHGSGLDLK